MKGGEILNVYQLITKKIIDKLTNAEVNNERFYWVKPFSISDEARYPCNYITHLPYKGINRILADNDEYLSYRQIKLLNEKHPDEFYHLRKGAKGKIIVYFDYIDMKDKNGNYVLDSDGNKLKKPLLRYYNVFSRQDVLDKDGVNLPSKFNIKHFEHNYADREILEISRFGHMVHTFCEKYGIDIQYVEDGTKAYFSPNENAIRIPAFQNFPYVYDYVATISHELIHASGIINGRISANELTTLETYAKEELVAEIGASLLCSNFRIEDNRYNYENDIAYLQGWRKYISDNDTKNVVLSAATCASAAVSLIYDKDLQLQILNDLKNGDTSSYENAEFYIKTDIEFTRKAFEINHMINDFIPEEIYDDVFPEEITEIIDFDYINEIDEDR